MTSALFHQIGFFIRRPEIKEIRKRTMNRKKVNLPISTAPLAIPLKPNTAATMARIKKFRVQFSIASFLSLEI